jgi:hypothetical protein
MSDKYFLAASGTSPIGDAPGSRVLWSGRCAVAEYAFEEPSSLPRWTLPEETEVVVTDDRVVYRDVTTGATGELQWPWPQHLRVQPGNRDTGRSATVTQIQLVCAGPAGTFPALVFAGGDLATVSDADRLANVLRQAIARYRVEHAGELGIPAPQTRMLSRLVIGPEFSNYQGGEGQTVSLLGSVAVSVAAPFDDEPFLDQYFPAAHGSATVPAQAGPMAEPADFGVTPPRLPRPGFDERLRAHPARPADDTTLRGAPDLEARAADLAARVANLVAGGHGLGRYENETTNLSAYLTGEENERAEQIRRTAARLAANSGRARGVGPRRAAEDEMGSSTRNV